jgi:hypothetical protein
MSALPKGFEALEKFAAEYALATPLERQRKRAALTIDELREFYAPRSTRTWTASFSI